MPDNRQVQKNATPNQSANPIEAFWRLKINDNQEGGGAAQSAPYPDRPGEPDCLYYLRTGLCGYGSNCRYNHPSYVSQGSLYGIELPERVGQPDCGYFLKTGTCKYGSTCKYHHPRDRRGAGPVSFNVVGLPMRQEEKQCPYYMQTGFCKFGVACKFDHPQPASLGTVLAVTGHADVGSMGSTVMPSSGLPYAGGLPAWSLPRVPYISGPRFPGPETYMPAFLPPQGVVPAQGWNTYMGNMSPMSPNGSTTVLYSNFIYNSKNLGESASRGLSSGTTPSLPERPDQPECRYFMNTGTCKYGSDCKFHHPKERIAQSGANPPGLPLRPGQAVCSYYSMYGLCKYGPTCKFDHPVVAVPHNYSLGLPNLAMIDSSRFSNPRSMSTAHSSETSPSKSSKFPDWVQKQDVASNKNEKSDTKTSEDSPEDAGSSPHSIPSSAAEPLHDQSG
ncbi:zinc finger CCCH domain-containing protein 3 isoform X3 [Carya illinoinensis]|uniref:zinc finger CCCH domain-containing protein 3 isoform X3 n=1 Tax=Carya illinoinensis TaxID=32201 RepID=UPI001C727A2D|nr:zinc finger CCCH domain-containing protein 3 isoform X3 [Carya illinoinensis]